MEYLDDVCRRTRVVAVYVSMFFVESVFSRINVFLRGGRTLHFIKRPCPPVPRILLISKVRFPGGAYALLGGIQRDAVLERG